MGKNNQRPAKKASGEKGAAKKAQEREISRQQFAPLDKHWQEKIDDLLATTIQRPTAPSFKTKDGTTITCQDLKYLVVPVSTHNDEHRFMETPRSIMSSYPPHIQGYVNEQRAGQEKRTDPNIVVWGENLGRLFDCNMGGVPEELLMVALENENCSGDAFMQLDYLFIPLHYQGVHWVLLGVAPRQGFLFLIDSIHSPISAYDEQIRLLKAIVLLAAKDFKHDWPILLPNNPDDKTTRLWPKQMAPDASSCGIFVLTYMMCLAFGYSLCCFRQPDIRFKRPRIIAEMLNKGFLPPFDYKLLDIPTAFADFTDFEVIGYERNKAVVDPAGPALGTTRRIEIPENWEPATVADIIDALNDYARTIGGFPTQFHPLEHQMVPCIFASEPPAYDHLKSKKALIDECKAKCIKGYTPWAKMKGNVLRKWMENEYRRTWFEPVQKDKVLKGKIEKNMGRLRKK